MHLLHEIIIMISVSSVTVDEDKAPVKSLGLPPVRPLCKQGRAKQTMLRLRLRDCG